MRSSQALRSPAYDMEPPHDHFAIIQKIRRKPCHVLASWPRQRKDQR
jgi:hypothetical protein